MKAEAYDFLERLIATISPSGYEDEAARVWEAQARTFADEVRRDLHGNTHAIVNAGGSPRIMFSGHYDEIGFLVTHIDDEGFLWIAPVGGWDPQIAQGHRVRIRGRKGSVPGVLGKCPIHLLKEEQRKQVSRIEDLWVDIGARNRKDAEKRVAVGDPLVLAHPMERLQGDMVTGRGFDNRAGAFVVLEAARRLAAKKPAAEIHVVATVQEEIGLRGARTAAFSVDPQVGIAVDMTFATDHPAMGDAVKREGKIKLGGGAVVTRGPNIHPRLFDLIVDTAVKEKIPYQVTANARPTGTDANAIQVNRGGVATALVSVPLRYMHSSCELIHLKDLEWCSRLLAAVSMRISPGTELRPF